MTPGAWVYLWIGLIMNGLAIAHGWSKCPKDDIPPLELIANVVAWPAVTIAVFVARGNVYVPPCKIQ